MLKNYERNFMSRMWLPPIETCCDQCKMITISVYRDATLHFATECTIHHRKGIPSPFAKSIKMRYKIIIPETLERQERMFYNDISKEDQERKKKYFEEWKKKHEKVD